MGFGSLQSCLNRAAEAGNIPVVSYLLNESDTVSWDISGALAAAAGEGKLDIMRVILTHKVAPPVEERVAALSAAAAAGQLAAIKLLVELGADLRLCWGSGYSSMGCLAHAITGRHWGVVGYLLQHGAPTGYAALMYAIQSPAAATAVELLLDYGARDILPDCPALQEAVRLGEQEVVDMLLSAGGTGASKTTTAQQFQVACCTAATSGDLHLLQHIINKLDQKCREQAVGLQERAGILSKALQSATRDWSAKGCQQHMREQTKTYKSVFKLLSDSLGANAGGYSGTQLGSDTEGSLPRNLHFLLDVGAVATDDALLIASRHGQADVVASLLSRSQGPVDPSGAAVGYAASHGHTEVLHLLLHHGANVAAACRAAVASGNDRVVAVLASLPSRLMPAWRATELEMVLADTCISRRTRGKVTRV
jgi:ankyrin repeat protein